MSKSRKRVFWTERDEKSFFRAWAKYEAVLRESKRKRRIYAKMSSEMGRKFSAQQLHEKTKNLRKRYRFEINVVSKGGSSNWRHFETVHKIIGPAADSSGKNCELPVKCEANESFEPIDVKTEVADLLTEAQLTSSNAASPSEQLQHSFHGTVSPYASDCASTSSEGSGVYSYKVFELLEKNTEIMKRMVEDQEKFNKEFISMMRQHNRTSVKFIEVLRKIGEKLEHRQEANRN